MPQLDIYLLTLFVWSILLFFIVIYIINVVYVNLNLFFALNLRFLKCFIDKMLMYFSIKNYNKIKKGVVLKEIFNFKKKKILDIKKILIKKDFKNVSTFLYNLFNYFNINFKEVDLFLKLNIEFYRII